ncbi:MAG: dihydrolipoamide succinyltransferase, partial [Gammaproteobacteria bacterium]|nr:dihydrolipoamide succinyltransferase [Gammaproteobacteria bacterium]
LVSPAVRRLLKENNLVIEQISGTGKNGRVNRNDIMAFLATSETPLERVADASSDKTSEISSRLIPHSTMRKSIARHMVESLLETSPHVTSVFEMDMSNIIEHRKWHKKEYAEQNVNLTYTAYFLMAMVDAIRKVPECNARYHKEALEIFNAINIGVGTALAEKGVVVPVVHDVQDMSLFDVAKALSKQTLKARNGDLTSADMKNGTITISNHGVSGSLFAAPIIINQPQVAILGIGKLEKRVIVEEINQQDTMQIKSMCYVSLSIDHRALDAHLTNLFLSIFVDKIESWGQ